ncbi:hypothetical protein PHAVU_011G116600 [Phaseolus vulgaris]
MGQNPSPETVLMTISVTALMALMSLNVVVHLITGTSACPGAKFYCRNLGSKPQFIVSSHVNDHFCDCCDGSDEHDGIICCPNTCVMGGNAESTISICKSKANKKEVKSEESVHNLTGLKLVFILQMLLVIFLVFLWSFRCRARSRSRLYH